VGLLLFSDPALDARCERRAGIAQKQNREHKMKKLFMLGAIIGVTAVLNASGADVKETWDKTCAKCHGADGKGQTKMGQKLGIRDYTDPKVQAAFTDEEAFKALKEGLKDKDGKTQMKPVEGLSDEEIKGLVQHVRKFKA
jgi:cytochrome c553